VPEVGLEPTLAEANTALNRARLPIPPLRQRDKPEYYQRMERAGNRAVCEVIFYFSWTLVKWDCTIPEWCHQALLQHVLLLAGQDRKTGGRSAAS
jgi:hypothetical protein